MPPATHLPSNIAKRFRKRKQKDVNDEAYWAEVAAKNSQNHNNKSATSSSTTIQAESVSKSDEVVEADSEGVKMGGSKKQSKKNKNKSKEKPQQKGSSMFWKSTTHSLFIPNDCKNKRRYNLRYVKGDICCNVPWIGVDDWLSVEIPNDEEELILNHIIGIVSVVDDDDGKQNIVGVWGSDAGDGHIELYCIDTFEFISDFDELSTRLCTEICPEMRDVFDDGSGMDREPINIPASVLTSLNEWYSESY